MKVFFIGIFRVVVESFVKSCKGQESLNRVIWFWGAIGYAITLFVINKLVILSDSYVVDGLISALVVIYFSWHIYVTKKCSPKKLKLSKEEKQKLKNEARRDRLKKITRKILLKESVANWNPTVVTIVIDLLFITQFAQYISKML